MNDILKQKNSELKTILSNCIGNSSIEENTKNACTYFINNKEGLKYLLSAYNVLERHYIIRKHLGKNFGQLNWKLINKLLLKERIYPRNVINFFTYILPAIIYISIVLSISFYFLNPTIMVFSFLVCVCAYFYHAIHLENRNASTYVNYKLSKEYKHLEIPDKQL